MTPYTEVSLCYNKRVAKIAFIQDFWSEMPGVAALSAALKAGGHETQAFIAGDRKAAVAEISNFSPDIAAFSCVTGSHKQAASFAGAIRAALPECLIIAGGAHPTFYPEFINNNNFDAICRGEGEGAMIDIANAVDHGADISKIANIAVRTGDVIRSNPPRAAIANLDSLPFPDYGVYYDKYSFLRSSPSKMFLTGRGCPYSCTFCFNKAYRDFYKPGVAPVRRMSPARAVEMVASVKHKWGLKFARFDDDVFALDKKWLFEFLPLYRDKIAAPFSCLVRANLMDDEIAAALADAGCRVAHFGIESGNEAIRNGLLGKGVSRDDIVRTAALLRERRIKIGAFNMLNLPGENLLNGWETVFINRHIKTNYPWCSLVQPYPGTQIEKAARVKGLLSKNFSADDIPVSYFRNSPIKNPDRYELENLHKFFYIAVKAPILWPLIRLLIRMPANAIFDLIFKTTYAIRYSRVYAVPLTRVLKIGRLNKKSY